MTQKPVRKRTKPKTLPHSLMTPFGKGGRYTTDPIRWWNRCRHRRVDEMCTDCKRGHT
jgi:hypothetical protein